MSITRVLQRYRKAAEQGDATAQYKFGGLYINGLGVPQDYQKAAQWLQKAAEQGHTDAQKSLSTMYRTGEGVPRNYLKALYWYIRSRS